LPPESRGTEKTGGLLRKGEVDKQRDGQERTGESKSWNLRNLINQETGKLDGKNSKENVLKDLF